MVNIMKDTPNFVQTELLPHLLCAVCKKVLSQFPIYCYNGGSTCGRCPYPDNGMRNEVYEVLAHKVKFPCCYEKYGCLENLLPAEVPQHEKLCSFRKYNCPIVSTPPCEWNGPLRDLLEHFELKHQMFLLTNNCFEVDFINSHNENYLLPYGEGLYLVNRNTDSKKHMFFCTVSYIGQDPCGENTFYRIILESGNKSASHEICSKMNTTTQILRDVINDILVDPMSIVAKIEIFQENPSDLIKVPDEKVDDTSINYDLLQELECLVCMEYMIPPIHQCVTGHSICLRCKESLEQCPTCRCEFKNTQNFALAQLIQHIDYPCKFYNQCKFVAKPKDIKQHEATCIYSPYPCPLKDYLECRDEAILFDQVYDHIVEAHYENLLETDTVVLPFIEEEVENSDELEDCFIIKYASKLFKLHFKYDISEFLFAAQLIGPANESSNYRFEIDILDSTGNMYRAYMNSPCGTLTDNENAFKDKKYFIIFLLEQIKHLIDNRLCFRVRILKN